MKSLLNAYLRNFRPTMVPPGEGDAYPAKPIHFVVPYAAGGPGDILARLIGQKLSENWKQPVNVENIPGPGGMKGAEAGLKAPADGYTLILAASPHYINPSLYAKVPYDTVKDFQGITLMISMPNILVINNNLPFKTVADVIAYAKAHPGELKYASGGTGTPSHLGAELLKTMTGIEIAHVEYKGHAPAGAAVRAGEAAMMFDAILLAMPEIKAGEVRALAVTSAKRSSVAADVPSVAESGLPGFDFSPGVGVLVRAGTPPAIVDKIYKEILNILNAPDVKARLAKDGANIVGNTPAQFMTYIQQEVDKWGKVVKAAGIKPQ